MSWGLRTYDVFVLLGDPTLGPAWREDRWSLLAAALDPLMPSLRGKASVRSRQVTPDDEDIRFGRIGWNARGHAKWTHKAGSSGALTDGARFMDVEVWTPSWTKCDDGPPDAFVGMRTYEEYPTVGFDPMLMIASAMDRGTPSREAALACAVSAADALSAVVRGHMTRTWTAVRQGPDFLNDIQDSWIGVLERPALRGPGPISLSDLKGAWEAF